MATNVGTRVGSSSSASASIGVLLARVVVPVWLLVAAVLKLVDASPSHLPAALVKWLGAAGIDLMFVLEFSIGVELTVVGVMWLLPRLARTAGIVMLAAFVPVLLGDVLMGASSCGCFGAVEIHPWITLSMDVSLLLGLWLLGRGAPTLALTDVLPTARVIAAGIWTVASFGAAFGFTGMLTPAEAAAGAGEASAVPSEGYYMPQYDSWIGKRWEEVPIAAWVRGMGQPQGSGVRYVLFYRKDCEHCHELMAVYFSGRLAAPTTAVAVPERDGFPSEGLQPFECGECSLAELPAGVDWFLQTPVLVRLEEGIVQCAAEVTAADPVCLTW